MSTTVEEVTRIVNDILIDVLGVTENQLTREADLVFDLGAEEEDLDLIVVALERSFNIVDFDAVVADDRVGDVIDSVIDVLANVPAQGPGR